MDWREKIDRLRLERDLSVRALAEIMGYPDRTVRNWLRDNRTPQDLLDALRRAGRALDVDPEWLMDDAKGWPPPAAPTALASRLRALPPELATLIRALDNDDSRAFLLCALECWQRSRPPSTRADTRG